MAHAQSAPSAPSRQARVTTSPAWGWFASVMIAIAGIFNLVDGIIGITNADYYASLASSQGVSLPVTNTIHTWGWAALGLGIAMIVTSLGIAVGVMWARVLGVIFAGLNMIFQLGFLPAYPFWGLVIIALDILIIYGIVVHGRREVATT